VNDIVEPLRPPRILPKPKKFAPLKNFSCGGMGRPWESMVNLWITKLYRGLATEPGQTVVVLEDANRQLIGVSSFKPQPIVAGTSVGKNAQRIHMIGTDRRYRGKRLQDGSSPGDVLLRGTLEQIKLACGGRMPSVSALVSPDNERSHKLFARHGFRQLPYMGEGEIIHLRPPDKRLSMVRLKLRRSA
jgi:hypothetical protein